jgi:hypothetical protein
MPSCPSCGCTKTKAIQDPLEGFVIRRRRVCAECGTEFDPPIPVGTGPVLILLGVMFLVAGISLGYVLLFGVEAIRAESVKSWAFGSLLLFGAGVVCIRMGWTYATNKKTDLTVWNPAKHANISQPQSPATRDQLR